MDDDPPSEKLVIELKNVRPLELIEMADCLLSAGAEYQEYLAENESAAASEEVKLFVREVRQGSAIFEMWAGCWNLLPQVLQHGTTLLRFLRNLKETVDFLKGVPGKKPRLTKKKLERATRIFQPTAKDVQGAQFNIYVESGGKLADSLHVGNIEANAIQNRARIEMETLKEPVVGMHENKVLYLYQARNDTQSATGDKAVIESISASPVRTTYATPEAKAKVIGVEGNPFRNAYVVDVRVETVENKPALYVVLRIHSTISRTTQPEMPLLDGPPSSPSTAG